MPSHVRRKHDGVDAGLPGCPAVDSRAVCVIVIGEQDLTPKHF